MRDFSNLVTALRINEDLFNQRDAVGIATLYRDAADAIEELVATVRSVVHCKDCEWWTKQEASIQGRCARLAIYPTGEYYCASGSKAEPPKGVE